MQVIRSINLIKVLILLGCCSISYASEDELIVQLSSGNVQGYSYNSGINAYPGIPYAKPPVAEWRFEAARKNDLLQNAQGDNDVFDGRVNENVQCPQISVLTGKPEIIGQEDCLYLNVYVPTKKANDGHPIMIYIHGGGFAWGTGTIFKPDYLLRDQNVILVTVNYRLGPFGFLNAGFPGDDKIYANIGLKDQTMAIKWVKDNIAKFNGDPDRITLFGNSAGGASTHFHLFSPLSKGLFQNAIVQSGAASCYWALKDRKESIHLTREFARLANCPVAPNVDMISCLKTKTMPELMVALEKFHVFDVDPIIAFSPTIEPEHDGAFITDSIENLLKKGQFYDVPVIFGTTPQEGAIRSAFFATNKATLVKYNKHFNELFRITTFKYWIENKNVEEIRRKYFGNEEIDESNLAKLTDLLTDVLMMCVDEAYDLHRKYSKAPVYSYNFQYKGSLTFAAVFGNNENLDLGVCHMDELFYLFPMEFFFEQHKNRKTFNEEDFNMSDMMVKLWVNFAANNNFDKVKSDMQIGWNPGKLDTVDRHLVIDREIPFQMGSNRFTDDLKKFWKRVTSSHIADNKTSKKDEL